MSSGIIGDHCPWMKSYALYLSGNRFMNRRLMGFSGSAVIIRIEWDGEETSDMMTLREYQLTLGAIAIVYGLNSSASAGKCIAT